MKKTTGRQVAGLILSPDWIQDPKRAAPYIDEMAEHGYVVVDLFVRDMRTTHLDAAAHDAVKALTAMVQERGMKCILDTDHTWWGCVIAEQHPEAAGWAIGSYQGAVHEGRFEVRANLPSLPGQIHFQELSAVFQPDGAGYRQIPVDQVSFDWQSYGQPAPGILVKGELCNSHYTGPLVFYIAFKGYGRADVAHPEYLRAQKALLEQYADIPLDGFGWDEPGKGLGHMAFFKAGEGFLRLFHRLHGYELRPNLIYLDRLDGTPQAVKVRCDFYGALNEMNYRAQDEHNKHARKLFGKNKELIFGTHHTWSGLPTDLTAGVIDYFRLGRLLTASWTDGAWDFDPKYPAFHFMLAEGIRKELGLRDAYYNDWTARLPLIEDMRFANRYKMLFHVNWFNIFFSDYSENLINWRLEPARSAARAEIASLDRFDRILDDGRFLPHSDVAWLFHWEGIAAAPKWLTRTYYTASANMAQQLADRGLFASMMSVDAIRRATVGKGEFSVGPLRYKVLIVPYAHAIPGDVYDKIIELCRHGVAVVFWGPPPEFACDGRELGTGFARLVGMKPFTLREYQAAYMERNALPALAAWEPDWVDFAYPVSVTSGTAVRNREDEILYVKAPKLPLYYLSAPDPREDLCNLLETLLPPLLAEAYGERTYYRLFRDPARPDEQVLLAVAKGRVVDAQLPPSRLECNRAPRKHAELKGLFRLAGGELVLRGGTWCAVRFAGARLAEAISDGTEVRWNGKLQRQR